MIDMHIHVVNPRLPGVKEFPELPCAGPEEVARLLAAEMAGAGVGQLLGMGQLQPGEGAPDGEDPLGVESTRRVAAHLPGLHLIGAADPSRASPAHLRRCDEQLARGGIVALKGYLGYRHFGPEDPAYRPYYELAAKYSLPFIFHTGDTWSTAAKVKYAHPLRVDEVAVDHREVNFVMAHFGNPWLTDAAEVIYKNPNVWADLSGLLVGDAETFAAYEREGVWDRLATKLQEAMRYTERPDRFLYGTDWPLAPMATYREFVRRLWPASWPESCLDANARDLFALPRPGDEPAVSG